MTKLH